MSEPLHMISLGAGVQSSTMALMAAAGEITPMPAGAISTLEDRGQMSLFGNECEGMCGV